MVVANDGARSRVGDWLRAARETSHPHDGSRPTQQWLGNMTGRTAQQISSFECGREIPNLVALRELVTALEKNADLPARSVDMTSALLAWLGDRVEHDLPSDDPSTRQALEAIGASADSRPRSQGPIRSLADFPGSGPLTVIVGDRREWKANSAADCVIYSVATTDFMYLNHLGASFSDVAIRTDKLLVRMGPEYLAAMPELSQRNLLVIGSLAVNWGTRLLNERDTLFPLRVEAHAMAAVEKLATDGRFRDPKFASTFWELAQNKKAGQTLESLRRSYSKAWLRNQDLEVLAGAEALVLDVFGDSTAKSMMKKFAGLGFIDVADRTNHGTVTYATNDFATVSLARNPWDSTGRYRAVVCGGIHGPGTAVALRELLTNPERFRAHPLGAILEVEVNPDLDWATRFEKATVKFQTREYSVETVLSQLKEARTRSVPGNAISALMTNEEIESRIDFVSRILEEPPRPA